MFPVAVAMAADLETAFTQPPASTRPRCYWYWMDGHISQAGITRDLEAMKRVGIGEGYIGLIDGQSGAAPNREIKPLTDPWWQMIEHAVREGTRLGVDIGFFNAPGWSQSGGPWVKPEQSMRYVTLPEIRLRGPQHFAGKLPVPAGAFQPFAVLAFPAPAGDTDTATTRGAKVTKQPAQITFTLPESFTARSLTVQPSKAIHVNAEFQASEDGENFRTVRQFTVDRHNLGPGVGPVGLAPVVVAFPATVARAFRVVLSAPSDPGDIQISAAARVDTLAEKSLIKVFQDPLPPFDFYSWPQQAEPEAAELTIPPGAVRNLGKQVTADGTLTWDVPEGEWIVLHAGLLPTGTQNSPAPAEATGPEVDKMNRTALKAHFEAYVGKLLERMPAADRKSLKHVVADSYEQGPENWTEGFAQEFQNRYGYDPVRFLPVLTGRLVGSADQANRFLWDLRRLVADLVARDYVGGLRDLCRERGLKMWLENYGHWGFPSEFLLYGGSCDEISGEFWEAGSLGSVELRDASSAAHIYGMRPVFAEAFTGGPFFISTPWSLKKRGDWAFCQGINQFVLHVYIHQPSEERLPGMNAGFGTEFNRHNTWFEQSKAWIEYQRRCSVLLQAGLHVADVAYFIGEDAPKMAGLQSPALPPGYDFDYINADVLMHRAQVQGGRLVLPDQMSYRLLVLPPSETMRPQLLQKIASFVEAGLPVLGAPPSRSPSLQDFPGCDVQVQTLVRALWGQGKILPSGNLAAAFRKLNTPPDLEGVDPSEILFTHRRSAEADLYFLSNQTDAPADLTPGFRVAGKVPEFWHPETGKTETAAVYDSADQTTRVPVRLDPRGSVFVVFRHKAAADRIVEVQLNGKTVLSTVLKTNAVAEFSPGTFTEAVWVKPTDDTPLFPETSRGVIGITAARNDVIFPRHGDTIVPGGGHAGSGLAVGRNGVCVFEHGANYFAPVLVHAAALTNWTHVTVVYRQGQPTLYLDGRPVHTGLKGPHLVHASPPGAPFRGELGGYKQFGRALSDAAVLDLLKDMPRTLEVPVELTQNAAGRLEVRAWQSGRYALRTANGRSHSFQVPPVPPAMDLPGPWEVRFPTTTGLATPVRFDLLQSWTDRPEPAIKYFSGTAVYEKNFEIAPDQLGQDRTITLDLGRVGALAEVILNGVNLGTLWKAPYCVEVTDRLQPGANLLEIRVVNTWHNRLVGDKREPGLLTDRKPWTSTTPNYGRNEPLLASGLMGPVTLRTALRVHPLETAGKR